MHVSARNRVHVSVLAGLKGRLRHRDKVRDGGGEITQGTPKKNNSANLEPRMDLEMMLDACKQCEVNGKASNT